MRVIAILGAGELGGAVARQVAAADIASRVVIVDEQASVAQGKALDIRQAAPLDRYSTAIEGTGDESVVLTADVVVVADRAGSNIEWQDDAGASLLRRVAYLNTRAVLLCAGARQALLVERSVREAGLPRTRICGSAPEALRAAVVSMVALEAGAIPSDISLTVVGRPPHDIIVPWTQAAIGGRAAIDVLTPPALTRLDGRLTRLWPPAPMALASAATRVLRAIAGRRRDAVSLFVTAPRGEQESSGRVTMLPAHVGPAGVLHVLTPSLSPRDQVRLETVTGGA